MTTSDKTVNYLQELVEKAYKLDLLKKCRETKYILARITFAQLLKSRGYGSSAIGRILHLNHATVLNYFNSFDWFYKTNENFSSYYQAIEDEATKTYLERSELNEIELKKELIMLHKENKSLYLANKELKKQIEELKQSKVMYLESKM